MTSGPPLLDVGLWLRPGSIEAREGYLRWRANEEWSLADDPMAVETRRADGLLEQFVRLKDDPTGKATLKFARRWGVLGFCEHQLPRSHGAVPSGTALHRVLARSLLEGDLPTDDASTEGDSGAWWETIGETRSICPQVTSGGWYIESVNSWWRMAEVFSLISSLADDEWSGKVVNEVNWWRLSPRLMGEPTEYRRAFQGGRRLDGSPAPVTFLEETPDQQMSDRARQLIGTLVDDLMRLGDVRLGLEWTGSAPEIRFQVGGLLGALAIELAFAVTRGPGFAVCSGCGNVYVPTRRPARGRRSYCLPCRDGGVPIRDAQRDRRRRARDRATEHPGATG